MPNRLALESSPYLLQHAHNPVDWFPWGPEAFETAQRQDRPIFLSVGYSTCYWCHVMERQSFENADIAALMNERFVNIKVDREERPDVDQLYMNAVHAQSGHGGWPMSVFLTPRLKPFYTGTYFPPRDGQGRIGFPRLLAAIDQAWRLRRPQILQTADELVAALQGMAEPQAPRNPATIDPAFIESALQRSTADYDDAAGGFGSAPKFPRQTLLELVLDSQSKFPDPTRLRQVLHTLDAMANGGIRDHLGGAFHRYSTDDQWLVPHFEIMLYDNAMLAFVYTQSFAQTHDDRHAAVARGILDFVLREMTSADGAFHTAFDAEVDAQEGLSYLWTKEEVQEVLGPDAEEFNRVYGLAAGPNFADPHHGAGASNKNVLHLAEPISPSAAPRLAAMRQKLYDRRRQRKQPLLDTKVLTSWNSLMIRAMAHAGKVLNESRYAQAAARAADFLLRVHRDPAGNIARMSKDQKPKGAGFLDDYAFLAQALLSIGREAAGREIADRMCEQFLDPISGGFYFTSAGASDILVRQKTAADSPLPSGNAIAAEVMLQLGKPQIARKTLALFAGQLHRFGAGMSSLVQTAMHYVQAHGDIDHRAADDHLAKFTPPEEIIKLTASWDGADRLNVSVNIAAGYHLTPSSTRLTVAGEAAALVTEIAYPPSTLRQFADEPIPTYDGRLELVVHFSRPPAARPLRLVLHCQPCNQEMCLAAGTEELLVP